MKSIFRYLNQMEQYDPDTYLHSCRVSYISYFIGCKLGLSISELSTLRNAAYLHDLGKLKIPKHVLNKKGKLSSEEWLIIKDHPIIGHRLLIHSANSWNQIGEAVLSHHEHFDGNGYPGGFRGEDIPFLGRIIAIADGLDAMLTNRPYRHSLPLVNAFREIKENSGYQYDPYITQVLFESRINT